MENHKLNQTMNKLILNLKRNLNGSNDEYIQRSREHFIYSINKSNYTYISKFTIIENEQWIPHI